VGRRFQRVHIDIIGPLMPRSKRGYKYILVAQDAFSKWPEAWPIRNDKAPTVAKKLVDEWTSRYGCPERIHSDKGPNFESKVFKEMCWLMGIEKTNTTSYHPQGNGQVENFNKSLKNMLITMVNEKGTDWDQHIPSCLLAYRTSVQVSIDETPAQMVFGEELSLPIDIMLGTTEDVPLSSQFTRDLRDSLEEAHENAREHLGAAQRRQRQQYNTRSRDSSFQVGDLVWLRNFKLNPGEIPKFHKMWKGPYEILEVISEVNYRVKRVGQLKKEVVHINNMKKYYQRPETQVQDLTDVSQEEEETDQSSRTQEEEEETDQSSRTPDPEEETDQSSRTQEEEEETDQSSMTPEEEEEEEEDIVTVITTQPLPNNPGGQIINSNPWWPSGGNQENENFEQNLFEDVSNPWWPSGNQETETPVSNESVSDESVDGPSPYNLRPRDALKAPSRFMANLVTFSSNLLNW